MSAIKESASYDFTHLSSGTSVVPIADTTRGFRSPSTPDLEGVTMRGTGVTRPDGGDRTLVAKAKKEAKLQKKENRNMLKKEKAKARGSARKAGHKVPAYNSNFLNDKMLTAGRGSSSGGVSADDDAAQKAATAHKFMEKSSFVPPEAAPTVLEGAVENAEKKVRSSNFDRC